MEHHVQDHLVTLDVASPIWDRFFMVAPLVIVGTCEPDGTYDLAPKHMALPMGWQNYFGFICTPEHGTYQNIKRDRIFTVTFPRPSQVVMASLAAAPRCEDQVKYGLKVLPTFPARKLEGVFLEDGYLFLECTLDRIVDGFGRNSLITGQIVAAHVDEEALRVSEREDEAVLRSVPLLAYLPPGRYAAIEESEAFPFPVGLKR